MRCISITATSCLALLGLAACGLLEQDPATFSIGGLVSGLAEAERVTIETNDEQLEIDSNGRFAFTQEHESGTRYDVTVVAQPQTQRCRVDNASGTIDEADADDVTIVCEDAFRLGGEVSGLAEEERLTIESNDEQLEIDRNGSFRFESRFQPGADYAASISEQPETQQCSIDNASGTFGNADVDDLFIDCRDPVTLSWDPSRHSSVGRPGGGYRVFFSDEAGFRPDDAGVQEVEVTHDSATGETPTSITLPDLEPGSWFFRVQAFSELGESTLSSETEHTVE